MLVDIFEPGSRTDHYKTIRARLARAEESLAKGSPWAEDARKYGPFAPAALILLESHTHLAAGGYQNLKESVDSVTSFQIRKALADLYFQPEATETITAGMVFRREFGLSTRLYTNP